MENFHPKGVVVRDVESLRFIVWAHPDGRVSDGYAWPFNFDNKSLDFGMRLDRLVRSE